MPINLLQLREIRHAPVFYVSEEAEGNDLGSCFEHEDRCKQEVEQFQCELKLLQMQRDIKAL